MSRGLGDAEGCSLMGNSAEHQLHGLPKPVTTPWAALCSGGKSSLHSANSSSCFFRAGRQEPRGRERAQATSWPPHLGPGLGPLRPGVLVNTPGTPAHIRCGVTGTRCALHPEKIKNKQVKYMKRSSLRQGTLGHEVEGPRTTEYLCLLPCETFWVLAQGRRPRPEGGREMEVCWVRLSHSTRRGTVSLEGQR